MPNIREDVLQVFRAELRKTAGLADLVSRASPRLKNIGAAGGVGSLAGAALGGVGGAVSRFHQARQEGAGGGDAAFAALRGGASGAATGGALGALAGGGVGGFAKGDLSSLTQRRGPLGAAARFGQRQVHSMTGMLSPSELEGVRGGAYAARKNMEGAGSAVSRAVTAPNQAGLQKAIKGYGKANKALEASESAQNMGLTSIPGYVGALKEHGVGKVLSTSVKEQLRNAPPAMAGLMVGLPALSAAGTLARPENPTGPGKGEELGKNLGNALGGVVGGAIPLTGQLVAGGVLGHAGALAGRGVDRLRGRRPGSTQPAPVEGQIST